MTRVEPQRHRKEIIIIIIIIIILVITFMQSICNYIPEINNFSIAYSAAAVLYLQFMLQVMLFRPLNMFCTSTFSLSAVQCPVWLYS
jgi:membrane protein YdbS with pleckstrin-like domain